LFFFINLLFFFLYKHLAIHTIFVSDKSANTILGRIRRANSLFEELKQGNLERECREENCSREEAREIFENEEETQEYWKGFADGNQCDPNPCDHGSLCKDGIGDYSCTCLKGFEGKNCQLVILQFCTNNNGGCSHFCSLDHFRVVCSCAEGYELGEDESTCTPKVPFPCGRIQVQPNNRNTRSVSSNSSDILEDLSEPAGAIELLENGTILELEQSHMMNQSEEAKATVISPPIKVFEGGRIVGGKDCTIGQCPWQALLVDEKTQLFCGGTILNEEFVLTAAHCMNHTRYFKVIVGKYDRDENEDTESTHQVDKLFMHPKFVKKTYDNDIALLKLKDPIKFTKNVIPICLPDKELAENVLMNEPLGTVSGFGRVQERGRQASKLQSLSIPYVDRNECVESTNLDITQNMFCAGYSNKHKDACQGDSGGPHVTPYHNTYFITGIVSWGEGCARDGKFGIYTRVSRFLSWINWLMKV
uniref:coagulation factor Xa n=1 Tax=Latimeria chalumnae TaxID=7897 RepID=H2ZV68_LATCH